MSIKFEQTLTNEISVGPIRADKGPKAVGFASIQF